MKNPGNASTSRKSAYKSFISFVVIVGIVFLLPTLFLRSTKKEPFDTTAVNTLVEHNPDYVFIGNSFLDTRIDAEYLEQLLETEKVSILFKGGELSAHWYLRLKNQVIESGVKPKTVFIFFDDLKLTMPTARTTGSYKKRLEVLSHDKEETLEEVISKNLTRSEKLERKLDQIYPVQSARKSIERYIASISLIPTMPGDLAFLISKFAGVFSHKRVSLEMQKANNTKWSGFQSKVNGVFDIANQKKSNLQNFTPEGEKEDYDFANNYADSFLPVMIELAKENNVRLAFVRIQNRPDLNGNIHQSNELKKYVADLKDYILKNGCLYHDFTGDSSITRDMYLDGSHIEISHRKEYTKIFLEKFPEAFE